MPNYHCPECHLTVMVAHLINGVLCCPNCGGEYEQANESTESSD